MIYYDGHERRDVKVDRAEKLVMLKVLEEVTVKFGGADCEIVIWPDGLHRDVWPEQVGGHVPAPPLPCARGPHTQRRDYLKHLDNSCCCRRVLALQPDFQSERSGLERVVAAGGHRCIFLPKFHCLPGPRVICN